MERTQSGRFTDLDADKLRGGYYTPPEVAKWLASWAIRKPSDRVLEPSCGDGAFLEAAAARLEALGLRPSKSQVPLTGVEIIAEEAERSRARLKRSSHSVAVVHQGDFFEWWEKPGRRAFDAVIGNPPFLRYQSFPEPYRTRAMNIMATLGLSPNRLTNIWVPFVVASAAALSDGGRLALVLPAELLQVSYAAQLRSFLTDRFTRIDIVTCNELFFDKAEQEVLILFADGARTPNSSAAPCRVAVSEAGTVRELTHGSPDTLLAAAKPKDVRHDEEKWLKYFLTERQINFMRELRSSVGVTTLATHAKVDVGVVTGKNEFFVLNESQQAQMGLNPFTTPLVSRSVHLKGSRFTPSDWQSLSSNGERVHLLNLGRFNGAAPPGPLAKYIRAGEQQAVHKGYKCSIRNPWYAVPSVWNPDGFLFRQIHDFPRMVLNQVGATSTDTIHRVTCIENPTKVVTNTYTYLTAASAEIEGRSYGGGVLELEPTEAERLLMPKTLTRAIPVAEADKLVRAGRMQRLLEENSRLILHNSMGLSEKDCIELRDIWTRMRDRRWARRRSRRVAVEGAAMP